jgi:hypothetical protein
MYTRGRMQINQQTMRTHKKTEDKWVGTKNYHRRYVVVHKQHKSQIHSIITIYVLTHQDAFIILVSLLHITYYINISIMVLINSNLVLISTMISIS